MPLDFRYALRSLRKRPGFTAVAVVTLALGIGAATAVFSVVESVLLRPLPFPHANRLVAIGSYDPRFAGQMPPQALPYSLFDIWRQDRGDFADIAATGFMERPTLTGVGPAQRVTAPAVTANFFTLLGARPELGRLLVPEDDRPSTQAVVVLSHRFWMARFGGDPHVVGRTITLDTTLYTVVGVASAGFQSSPGPEAMDDMWRAMGAELARPGARNNVSVSLVGRLRPGVTPGDARAHLDRLARRAWVPSPDVRGQTLLSAVAPLGAGRVRSYGTPLLVMLAAVAMVLLVACANVGSLLTSRAIERGPEIAVRQALGAGRRRLLAQSLTETLVLALMGGVLGILLALWLVPALLAQAGTTSWVLPPGTRVSVDVPVLLAALGMAIVAGLLAGLGPALLASGKRAAEFLKTSAAPGSLKRVPGTRAHDLALVIQTALTLVLLVGAGLLGRSFLNMVTLDLGFDPSHTVAGEVTLPRARYAAPERRVAFVRQALDQLRALPGVTAVALGSGSPMRRFSYGSVRILEHPGAAKSSGVFGVTADYFRALGMPILRGTGFSADSAGDVVLNQAAARAFFPGEDPLGRRVALPVFHSADWVGTIVGIVGDTRQFYYDEAPRPVVYCPLVARPSPMLEVLVRTSAPPGQLETAVREAIQRVDPSLPVEHVSTYDAWLATVRSRQHFYGLVLSVFAMFGLALAAAGIFGSASFAVAQRTRELGLRMALGAEQRNVVALIVRRVTRAAIVGAVLGGVAALTATRVLRSLLYHVQPFDPVVFAAVGALLVTVCLLAGYLPARRAATVDPVEALRAE